MLTLARMEVLGLIASQAAISLEHAQLHADLELAQARTQQAEQETRRIVDGIPAMIWTASPDGRVTYVNQRWLDYGGRSLEEWRGWGWMSDVHPVDLDRWRTQMQSFLPAGRPGEIELRVRGAAARTGWFSSGLCPCRAGPGRSSAGS